MKKETEELGIIGQKYCNRKTGKTGVLDSRDGRFKTVMLIDEEGKGFSVSYATFRNNWRIAPAEDVPDMFTDRDCVILKNNKLYCAFIDNEDDTFTVHTVIDGELNIEQYNPVSIVLTEDRADYIFDINDYDEVKNAVYSAIVANIE